MVKKKYKSLQEESDLTLFSLQDSCMNISISELLFIVFMIVLYYSNYARGLFWFIAIVYILRGIQYLFDGLPTKHSQVRKELKNRGYRFGS